MQMATTLLWVALLLYGLGCAVSQSLMSIGGSLFALGCMVALAPQHWLEFSKAQKSAASLTLLWIIYSCCNLLFRENTDQTMHVLGRLPLLLVPLFGFVAPVRWLKKEWLGALLFLMGVGYIAATGQAAYQFSVEGIKAQGFFGRSIHFAYAMFFAFVFFFELWIRKMTFGRFRPFFSAGLACVIGLSILLAASRGIWAVTVLYCGVRMGPQFLKNRKSWPVFLCVFAVVVGALVFGFKSNPSYRKTLQSLSNLTSHPTYNTRIALWEYNLKTFRKSPWFGTGPERNGIDSAKVKAFAHRLPPGYVHFAHNIYLQSLADSGIIGTVLFFSVWFVLALAHPLTGTLLLMAALAGLTENIFNASRVFHPLYFYTLLSLWIVRAREKKRTDSIC